MSQLLIESYSFVECGLAEGLRKGPNIDTLEDHKPLVETEGHLLALEDLANVAETEEVDSIVIGTGYSGAMEVLDEVIEHFRRSVEVYVANTGKATGIYNELVRAGRKVLGAFHLTC